MLENVKLSTRERQVLKHLKDGHKNKEIATSIDVNQKTVSTYVARIRKKLEVDASKNSYFLVNKAIRLQCI